MIHLGRLFRGIGPMCRKEFVHLRRDRMTVFFALGIPILQMMMFDVFPELFRELGPGNRIRTDDLCKRSVRLNRFHKCALCFAFVGHRMGLKSCTRGNQP